MKRVAYYKGCLASLSAKELDSSTQALAPKVGLELVELETVTCCGAGDIHEAEPDYYLHLNARILAYAEAAGCDTLLTVCNVCTLNLRQANWQLKNDDDLRERVSTNLERVGVPPYSGNVEVRHLLWEIAEGDGYELLKQSAHKGLKGLKIAPFYGCQILRPSKLLGFEDPDRPWSLERIIEACGGEAIDYPAKIKCCGFPIIQAREETALGELIQPIEQAMEAGADAIVTPCPLCHLSLDAWQSKLKKHDRQGLRDADPAPLAAGRRRRRARGVGAEVQAPRRPGHAGAREARSLTASRRDDEDGRADAARRRRRGCGRLGLVRGRLGAVADARRLAAAACQRSSPVCGSRTSRTSTSACPRAVQLPPSGPWTGSASASPISWRSRATSSRARAVRRCCTECCSRGSVARTSCSAITTSRYSRDPFSRTAGFTDLSPARLLVDEAETIELRGRRGADSRRRPAGVSAGSLAPVGSWSTRIRRPAHPALPLPYILSFLPPGLFDLVLSGHMHDGQIAVPLGRDRKYRFAHPSTALQRPASTCSPGGTMHISPGLGTTFVPFRFFARPEATELVLQRP